MPAIKIVDFTSGQSCAILPSKMVMRLERNFCVVTSVCVFRFVYALLFKRNSEVKEMSNDSASNSFANFWSSSDEDFMEEDEDDVEEIVNRQTDITCLCHMTF